MVQIAHIIDPLDKKAKFLVSVTNRTPFDLPFLRLAVTPSASFASRLLIFHFTFYFFLSSQICLPAENVRKQLNFLFFLKKLKLFRSFGQSTKPTPYLFLSPSLSLLCLVLQEKEKKKYKAQKHLLKQKKKRLSNLLSQVFLRWKGLRVTLTEVPHHLREISQYMTPW